MPRYIEYHKEREGDPTTRRSFLVLLGTFTASLIAYSVSQELKKGNISQVYEEYLPDKAGFNEITWMGGKYIQPRTFSGNDWGNIKEYQKAIVEYSDKYGFDPKLVAAMMYVENPSADPKRMSKDGAVGLLQVMPKDGIAADFMCKNGPCFTDRPTIKQLEDPEFNIETSLKILKKYHNITGNIRGALVFYGPQGVGYEYSDMVLFVYNNLR